MGTAVKYIIKTDSNRTYSLYIMDAKEYNKGKFIGLFLFYDEDFFEDSEKMWTNLRHRIFFESSANAIKEKVIEYTEGRFEKIIFIEIPEPNLINN
jgi:hypothetical protein